MRVDHQVILKQNIKSVKELNKNAEAEKKNARDLPVKNKNQKPAAVYDKNTSAKKATSYSTMSIKELQIENNRAKQMLIDLVDSLLSKQGKTRKFLTEAEMTDIDPETRARAQEMIADNGPMGIEAVSDRIASFAINVAGGDTSKLKEIKKAVQRGYDLAMGDFGQSLPEISQKTLARTFEKLESWANPILEVD